MIREAFLLQIKPEKLEAAKALFTNMDAKLLAAYGKRGAYNFSVWNVENFLFGYREIDETAAPSAEDIAVIDAFRASLAEYGEIIGDPVTKPMRLMYSDIGVVRSAKSLIRHRVFATHLKPGCHEEYKRRHDGLVAARGDEIKLGPESNFTIWNGGDYIFGYCEIVRSFDHEPTEEENAATIAWETRGLEIMDWITDDVDWITGQKHPAIQLVAKVL